MRFVRLPILAALLTIPLSLLVTIHGGWACPLPHPSRSAGAVRAVAATRMHGVKNMGSLPYSFPMSVLGVSGYNSDCQPSLSAVTGGATPYIYFVAGENGGPPYDESEDPSWTGFSIYEARWDGTKWTDRRVLPSPVNPGGFPSVTQDRSELYFVSTNKFKKATWGGTEWDSAVTLGWPFNVSGVLYEAPEISHDGTKLYFTMNATVDSSGTIVAPPPGEDGNKDIWVVDVAGTTFSNLTNLGPGINTDDVETRPTISPEGTQLIFSNFGGHREGPTFGGVELYISNYANGAWQPAVPLPPPVNNDYPACSGHWADDNTLYIASEVTEGGFGEEDIWHTIPDGETPELDDYFEVPVFDSGPTVWDVLTVFPSEVIVHCILALDSMTLLAGTAPGGQVYRSTNGGVTWSPIFLGPQVLRVYDLEEDSDGNVYAGTYPAGRIFKSTDAGATWAPTGNLPDPEVTAVRTIASLSNGDLLVGVAPEFSAGGGNREGRCYRSTNGGTTWTSSASIPLVETGVYVLEEVEPGVVLAGARIFGAKIARSTNYGLSWSVIEVISHDGTPGVFEFFTARNDSVWTGGWKHGKPGVLAYSTDAGENWTEVTLPEKDDGILIARVFDMKWSDEHGWIMGIQPGPGTIAWRSWNGREDWTALDHLEDARELLDLEPTPDGRLLAATSGFGEIWYLDSPTSSASSRSPGVATMTLRLRNPSPLTLQGSLSLGRGGRIEAELYDVRGARLASIWSGVLDAGEHRVDWSLARKSKYRLGSGVYLVKVSSGDEFTTQKVILER